MQPVVPDVPQPTVRSPPIPTSFPTSSTFNRHEKALTADDNVAPIPHTPLTPATQRDNVKQDVKSLLHEFGVLPIAPRYEQHQQQSRRDRDRPQYDDHSRSSSSYHRSYSTVEMEPNLQDYDPNTLPNTIQEALRWKGTNNKSYTHYLSHPLGRLSEHHLVKNSLDINSQSTLYNDVMILTTILLTFWSVEVANFHRVDRAKNDFSLNDRAKIQVFGETYDGSSCLYSYTGRLLQHFSQHRLPYVHLYDILSKGTDLKGKAYNEWQEQVDSANSSLVQEDITQLILRAPSLHCYQMRSIAEMIVDLIFFRVLIFGQIKNKESIKNDLNKLRLVSNIPSATYDGILKLSQTIIRTFRLFMHDTNAVQDLVRILTRCIGNTGADYAQKSADFSFNLSQRISQFSRDQDHTFHSLDRSEQNIRIFTVIEKYCRELQDCIRQTLHGQSLAMTSTPAPTYATAPLSKSYPSSSFRPRGLPSPTFKRVNVNSVVVQSSPSSSSAQATTTQSLHHIPISDRVDCEVDPVYKYAQAKVLSYLLTEQDDKELPDGALLMNADDTSPEPTIHVLVSQIHDMDISSQSKPIIDTKYTIDKVPFMGNCSLCGEKRHDADHCRHKSYTNPDQVNLNSFTYFTDEVLHQKLQNAHDYGFLRGATQDEIRWVLDKIRELRQARTLLYQHKPGPPVHYGPPGNSFQRNSTPPRSNSPYGYNRPSSYDSRAPSPYERLPPQPSHPFPPSTDPSL